MKTYTRFLVTYFSKDGNFYDTNMEYKNAKTAIHCAKHKLGNYKNFDTEEIQVYKNVHRLSDDERVSAELIYSVEV